MNYHIKKSDIENKINVHFKKNNASSLFHYICDNIKQWTFNEIRTTLKIISEIAKEPKHTSTTIDVLTLLNDRKYATGSKKQSQNLHIVRKKLYRVFRALPYVKNETTTENKYR